MAQPNPVQTGVKDIAIVGAGPCGLAAAKYLLAQGTFETIVVFEQQDEVGGVWNYSAQPSATLRVPQVSAFCPPDPPLRPPGADGPPVFPTPMYELLHTNIPGPLMAYSDLAFPAESLIFPSRQVVQDYLVEYSRDVRHCIRFCTSVKDIRLRQESGRDCWDVTVESTNTGKASTEVFDAVVVASGHYAIPFIPDLRGIGVFHTRHPRVIAHSKLYRSPEAYADKKVVVVGNAASGLDIAAQVGRHCKKPLLLSVRSPTPPANLAFVGCEEVPVIEEFLADERGVRLEGGRIERDIDAIIFATGYLFTFPFLTSLAPPLVTDGRKVHGLYKHLFHIEHPTLAFPGLPIKVVPFPLAESQAAMFARVWAGLIQTPSAQEMREWEEREEAEARKRGKAFHVFPKLGDVDYINGTHEEIMKSETPGKEPPRWSAELIWQRGIYAEAKLRFEEQGRSAKTLEELGFHFQPGTEDHGAPEIL